MNPPSALHSAMGRERKPFSYLPGGLDLSQIKSERMAQRLMRNAMNQGVPEVPAHQIQSPPTPSTPIAVPNFSCLPVQVIPTGFTLPANPKSLLRSRSNPDRNRVPPQRTETPQTSNPPVAQTRIDQLQNSITKTAPQVPQTNNAYNNRPASMFEYGYSPNNNTLPKTNYGSDGITTPTLPEISYEAEYLTTEPMYYERPENKRYSVPAYATNQATTTLPEQPNNANVAYTETTAASPQQLNIDSTSKFDKNANLMSNEPEKNEADTDCSALQRNPNNTETSSSILASESINIEPIRFDSKDVQVPIFNDNIISFEQKAGNICIDKEVNETCSVNLPEVDVNVTLYGAIESKPAEDITESSDEQKQVKVVKRVVKKEKKVEESESNVENQNGDHNGDAEAELVVKLPAKKSGSKTETKVEVLKKTLPDGSIEEVTKTTTKTTASDGSISIKTKTETKTIPKQDFSEEEVEEEEEEEEQHETGKQIVREPRVSVVQEKAQKVIVKKEESTAATTTKHKVTVETNEPESEEEVEEVVEPVKETKVVENKVSEPEVKKVQVVEKAEEEEEEDEEEEEEEKVVVVKKPAAEPVEQEASITKKDEEEEESEEEEEVVVVQKAAPVESKQEEVLKENEEEEVEEEEEYEETEEVKVETKTPEPKPEVKPVPVEENKSKEDDEESEYTDEEIESEPEEKPKPAPVEKSEVPANSEKSEPEAEKPAPKEEKADEPVSVTVKLEQKVPLREPSIPLEKVEDVEIKPIGATETVTKSHTQNTEIITSPVAAGSLSTQTEYNRVENIVTVNRTTKTLDNTYEQITQSGIPTMKTYFAPNRERVSTSPQPSKPYTPAYTPEPPRTERRHSLLLDRLSTERQMPGSEVYQNNYSNQYNNQTYEQRWSQEPQSEIVNVSNVKPSTITNSQWYQQSRNENVLYNNLTPSTAPPASQLWSQPQQPQPQPPQQQQPLPQQPQQQYQPSYSQSTQDYSKVSTNTYQQNSYPSYTPKPSSWGNNNLSNVDTIPSINVQSNQYSNRSQETSYPNSSQQYSSSYVPPPWEQDPNYVAPASSSFFQPRTDVPQPSQTPNTFSPNAHPGWKPPQTKFSKPPPTAYVPPAPNQSFVKSVNAAEPPRQPGRKTYYSEYERRYITVPESTYVPGESKFQAQPNPSPQYYYDNNDQPTEQSEPQWRKELREFTEKTSQTQYHTQQSVNPPWESEPNYAKSPNAKYTPTPSWSQTLRPQSWRERSFESELVSESQEFTKSNTLGRARPVSSYVKPSEAPVLERPRGVSVDRYNPNSYSGPIQSEHPPVQAQTLTAATAPHSKGYHNPNVPAYHARASAEPREQPVYQHRGPVDHRASPLQSRSFKYLQWITGTEQ